MEGLKTLFYHYQSDVPQLPETEKQRQTVIEQRGQFEREEMDEETNALVSLAELQGWLGGFKFALQIASDCGIGGGAK